MELDATHRNTKLSTRSHGPWRTSLVGGLLLLVLLTHGPAAAAGQAAVATAPAPAQDGSTPPGGPSRIDAQPILMQWRVRQDEDPRRLT